MNEKRKWLPLKTISVVLFLTVAVLLLWNAFATPYPWAIDSLQQKAVEQATQEAINTARQEGDSGKPYLKDIDYMKLTLGSCYVGTKAETQNNLIWEIRYRDKPVGYVMQDLGTLRFSALAGNYESFKLVDLEEISLDDYKKVKDSSVELGPFEWKLPFGWVTVDGHKAYRQINGYLFSHGLGIVDDYYYEFDENGYLIKAIGPALDSETEN
ncbi:hypothetical protein [Lancefieldella rimae]|uniref:hypothetical protein n=1 Tax=Lancefieldella rimae TaxID=1383 RepID=UPI0028E3078E|nr:hypothetical protein [Lancefieldella rimae]